MVKRGGDDIIKDFEEKFQEVRVEVKRIKTFTVHYTCSFSGDHLLNSKYSKEELEALYMGTSSEARKRFQRSGSFQRRQSLTGDRDLLLEIHVLRDSPDLITTDLEMVDSG